MANGKWASTSTSTDTVSLVEEVNAAHDDKQTYKYDDNVESA